jgi:FlaA1/EpsC-like NDP-sugar epimerase
MSTLSIPLASHEALRQLLALLRRNRLAVVSLLDMALVFGLWFAAYAFRLGVDSPRYDFESVAWSAAAVAALYGAVFFAFGVPRGMWRHAGLSEISRISAAGLIAGACVALVGRQAMNPPVPLAVLLLHPLFVVFASSALRAIYRLLIEALRGATRGTTDYMGLKPILVIGAGSSGRRVINAIHRKGEWYVVGVLDDDPGKLGASVEGVRVVGSTDALADRQRFPAVREAVLAISQSDVDVRSRLLKLASQAGIRLMILPGTGELMADGGRVLANAQRPREVKLEELLERDVVSLDEAAIAQLHSDRVILVTGAGGSIGSELCRQLARYGPKRLVLLDVSEFALYQITEALRTEMPQLVLTSLVGDVRDVGTLHHVFRSVRPSLVYHAAAYKHVPLMEDDNAWQALQNNVIGTYRTAVAAHEHGVERFVLISTDKAVNPTNVMGASKRAAEMLLSNLAAKSTTLFMAVRFGNVLGSSGSVIPKFQAQIAAGGPVTVTHPEITRYFMTIPEAAGLVLQAAAMGESGQVFVLDMGKPVKVVEIAKKLIQLAGKTEDQIGIVFSGLRPGEKLYEELLADADTTVATVHPKLRIAKLREFRDDGWMNALLDWLDSDLTMPPGTIRAHLRRFVPEYSPREYTHLPGPEDSGSHRVVNFRRR